MRSVYLIRQPLFLPWRLGQFSHATVLSRFNEVVGHFRHLTEFERIGIPFHFATLPQTLIFMRQHPRPLQLLAGCNPPRQAPQGENS